MTRYLTAAALALVLSAPAFAQEPAGDWIVTVRGNAKVQPAFPGAKNYGVMGYPSLSFRRATTPQRFTAPDDNISFALYDAGWLKAGPSARFMGARRASEHRILTGIHDVGWTLELGGFVELWPMEKLRGRIDLRQAVNGHKGFVADLGLDYVETAGAWTFSIGPRVSYGDQSFMRSWFGVTPAEAVANGRVTAYTASSGFSSVGTTVGATYTFNPQWQLTAYARYDQLIGPAARSPVVRVLGTEHQATFGLKLAYSFGVKGF